MITQVIPKLTSDDCLGYKCTSSSYQGRNCEPFRAFDGYIPGASSSQSYTFATAKSVIEGWLKIELPEPQYITGASLYPYGAMKTSTIKDFIIKGSNDDIAWVELYVGTNPNTTPLTSFDFVFDKIGKYKYYMIEFSSNYGYTYSAIGELEFYLDDSLINKYLVRTEDKVYTIENDTLVEIDESINLDVIKNKGCQIEDIENNLDKISNNFQILSIVEHPVCINKYKSDTEMIVASNDFPTTIQSNIDFFENQTEITGNGEIKIAFSIDEGVTWKTHDGTGFIDLPITVPCKPHNELTEDELIQWNSARDEILANGIDSDTLKNLDFNTLTFDKIRFAYVLHIDSIEDTALNKKLIWQFDAKGSMKLMKDDEIDIEVLSTGIKVTPKINSSLIKLNIVTDR